MIKLKNKPYTGNIKRSDVPINKDKRIFRSTAGKHHNINNVGAPMRGGIRL